MSPQEQANEIAEKCDHIAAEEMPLRSYDYRPAPAACVACIASALAASAAKSVDSTGYIQCSRCGQGSRNQTVIQDDKTSDRWLCIRCVTTERDALKRELEALKK